MILKKVLEEKNSSLQCQKFEVLKQWYFSNLNIYFFLVPTGLLALQGNDPSGRIIRDKLNEMNMLTDFIQGLYFK